jgi:hypothetical protein
LLLLELTLEKKDERKVEFFGDYGIVTSS